MLSGNALRALGGVSRLCSEAAEGAEAAPGVLKLSSSHVAGRHNLLLHQACFVLDPPPSAKYAKVWFFFGCVLSFMCPLGGSPRGAQVCPGAEGRMARSCDRMNPCEKQAVSAAGVSPRDDDPQETAQWLERLEAVIARGGAVRAAHLLERLNDRVVALPRPQTEKTRSRHVGVLRGVGLTRLYQ